MDYFAKRLSEALAAPKLGMKFWNKRVEPFDPDRFLAYFFKTKMGHQRIRDAKPAMLVRIESDSFDLLATDEPLPDEDSWVRGDEINGVLVWRSRFPDAERWIIRSWPDGNNNGFYSLEEVLVQAKQYLRIE